MTNLIKFRSLFRFQVLKQRSDFNHEMFCAVLLERQTSDCDIKCRITFLFQ